MIPRLVIHLYNIHISEYIVTHLIPSFNDNLWYITTFFDNRISYRLYKNRIYTFFADTHLDQKSRIIQEIKQDIGIANELSSKTKQHIRDLFCEFGYDRFFGRTDVQNILGLTASPSSALLKRMLELDLIYPMKGKGKGKYLFRNYKR